MGSNSSSSGGGGGGNQQAKARRLMTTTPNYGKPKTKSVTAGTLSDPREKDDTAAKASLFRETGATNIRNTVSKFPTPTLVIASKPLQAGSRITRDFFKDKVLGSKNYKGTTKQDFERMSRTAQESMYKSYITGRTSGKTDAYGNPLSQGDGGGAIASSGQVVQAPKVDAAPTTAEVSQATTTEAAEDSLILRKRRAKAKGRSPTIMTGVTGVTGSLTLGKPSLLGRA
jgi:hypothetical protein